jgi:hypothetical protein
MPGNLPPHKTFDTQRLVHRQEKDGFLEAINRPKKRVFVVEGDRGAGKTFFLLDLYHYFLAQEASGVCPFLVSLFPYDVPEFEKLPNIWLNAQGNFQPTDLVNLLKKLGAYLKIEFIDSLDEENRPEYMARGLAKMHGTPILLIDSIYECDEKLRIELEKYILVPFLATENAIIILSGRGKRPIWTNPELRDAETILLDRVPVEFVREQLKKMGSQHQASAEKIWQWSGGYPLLVTLLGQTGELSLSKLDQAIQTLIGETLPGEHPAFDRVYTAIQEFALLSKPFRIPDVDTYLFAEDDAEKRAKTDNLVKTLLQSYLLFWTNRDGRNGYVLNHSVAHPVREWLREQKLLLERYHAAWDKNIQALEMAFPGIDLEEYRTMFAMPEPTH